MATRSKRSRTVTVNMEGVESGGRSIPDGTYLAEVDSIEEKESKNENPMLELKWKVTDKSHTGVKVYDNLSLLPQALWRLRTLLEALGEEVPDSEMDIQLDDIEGKECYIEITNEDYEGKQRPRVTGYVSVEGGESDGKDERSEPRRAKGDDDKDDDDDDDKKDRRVGRRGEAEAANGKFKEKQKVQFRDDKNKLVKGTITEIDDDVAKVKDQKGEMWEIALEELEAA